jgi:hypothetical protein
MKAYSRRQFIKQLGAGGALLFASRGLFALPKIVFSGNDETFEMLVVGDSHISGQGLQEKNKFYNLVRQWLQEEVFGAAGQVNLKVKAHSGSRIELHADELEKMRQAGDDINKSYHREANLSSPSISAQIDVARQEYERPEAVNLVMLSGGITDVLVANTVNPFVKEEKVRALVHRYCNDAMGGLLEKTTAAFPKALVVVIGYFPIVSTKSDINKITRYLCKAVKFPHPLQFALTNGLSRQFLKILRRKMARRSRLWVTESNRETRAAIARVNAKDGGQRIIFVESPITEANCFGTKNSLLWETDKDNFPADEAYAVRKEMCAQVFDEIKFDHYGRLSVRLCELAAIGHPNVEGAKAFAEAIKSGLKPIFAEAHQSRKFQIV